MDQRAKLASAAAIVATLLSGGMAAAATTGMLGAADAADWHAAPYVAAVTSTGASGSPTAPGSPGHPVPASATGAAVGARTPASAGTVAAAGGAPRRSCRAYPSAAPSKTNAAALPMVAAPIFRLGGCGARTSAFGRDGMDETLDDMIALAGEGSAERTAGVP